MHYEDQSEDAKRLLADLRRINPRAFPTLPEFQPDGTRTLAWKVRFAKPDVQGIKPFRKVDKIEVHEESENPEKFVSLFLNNRYPDMMNRRLQVRLDPVPLDYEQPKNHTRFVVISDTHGRHRQMKHPLPPGDVLLHCGDFTDLGKEDEVRDFNEWLGTLPYKEKIVIAGNHEVSFDPEIVKHAREVKARSGYYRFIYVAKIPEEVTDDWQKVLSNCTLLHDAEISYNGIRIYGCPWNPEFGSWAFNVERGQDILDKWNKIPGDGIDILMTHCPPAGQLDIATKGGRVGCVELMQTVQTRVMPKYHVYGHIHESYGFNTDGKHFFMNASTVNSDYEAKNRALIIDFPTPEGGKEGLGERIQY